MFAGNIGAAQDFPSLLSAAERLRAYPDIHWVILGGGREADWVRKEVVARGLSAQVHLLGSFPVDAMPAFYAQSDCLLVSLKRDPIFALTIPAKIQSYLAGGRPIVGMLDGEGARVIAEAGAGLSGPAEDPAALADNVLRLYRLPADARARMGAAGRACYEREFARDVLISSLEQWLEEAAAAYRRR
jgi:glycosyltransferase involved in cell wall biosynthesis